MRARAENERKPGAENRPAAARLSSSSWWLPGWCSCKKVVAGEGQRDLKKYERRKPSRDNHGIRGKRGEGGSPSIIALSPGKEREIIASACLPASIERSQQFEVTDRVLKFLCFFFVFRLSALILL